MARFKNNHVIGFRVEFAAEKLALDRLARSRNQTRSDLLRTLVRKALLADLRPEEQNNKVNV